MPYKVIVADNYHYMDESEWYELGTFSTAQLALCAAQRIVDDYLSSAYSPNMSSSELYQSFTQFGEDPFIVSTGESEARFSAWGYARQRCREIAGD
jgi:hypothetical protein